MGIGDLIPTFGSFFLTGAAFIVALSVIVTIHEFGHYIVGRWSGIHAEVFSLGFGPRLASRVDRHGTRWQVAAIPLGGYVKFLGDANAASAGADLSTMSRLSPAELRRTMHGAPLWARMATVAAGPIFNFILSILVFAGIFLASGTPIDQPTIGKLVDLPGGTYDVREGDTLLAVDGQTISDWESLYALSEKPTPKDTLQYTVKRNDQQLTVAGPVLYPARAVAVPAGGAALKAGLQKGDVILKIDGAPIIAFSDIQAQVRAGGGKPIQLTVWRSGKEFDVTLTPKVTDLPKADGGFETRYLIGLQGDFFFEPALRPTGLLEAGKGAVSQVWFVAKSSVSGIFHVVAGKISACNMRGAISIAETSGQAAAQGPTSFIWFIAVLSAAVGLLNLFPIPMLDGGHLVFYAYEWAVGRPLPARLLNVLVSIGLFIVLAVTVFGLSNDVLCR